MCVGRVINEDGTSNLKDIDPDSKQLVRKIRARLITTYDIPFYKLPGIWWKRKGNSVGFQKR